MTIYAFISDIHGNEIALRTVLKEIDGQKIKNILCLGDIVGYGPRPRECVDIVRARNIPSAIGNHDLTASTLRDMGNYHEESGAALEWTRRQLSQKDKDYLRNLKSSIKFDEFTITHGCPFGLDEFEYVIGPDEAFDKVFSRLKEFKSAEERKKYEICFIGHTHSPCHYSLSKRIVRPKKKNVQGDHAYGDLALKLSKSSYHLINCGSVGQPRDDDSRACYVTFDTKSRELKYHRVNYNIEKVQAQILATTLPGNLAARLENGR
jgi:predicted phosphodiesterase